MTRLYTPTPSDDWIAEQYDAIIGTETIGTPFEDQSQRNAEYQFFGRITTSHTDNSINLGTQATENMTMEWQKAVDELLMDSDDEIFKEDMEINEKMGEKTDEEQERRKRGDRKEEKRKLNVLRQRRFRNKKRKTIVQLRQENNKMRKKLNQIDRKVDKLTKQVEQLLKKNE